MMSWLLFLEDYIGIVMSDIDCRLYAKIFQFTTIEGLTVFILEGGHIVIVCTVYRATSIS